MKLFSSLLRVIASSMQSSNGKCSGERIHHSIVARTTDVLFDHCSSVGHAWQHRKVCLSKDKLLFGKPGEKEVIDYIPLDEIVTVASKDGPKEGLDKSIHQNTKKLSVNRLLTLKMEDVRAPQVKLCLALYQHTGEAR